MRRQYSVIDKAFFTSTDPQYHQRIYGLEHLFRELNSEFNTTDNTSETSEQVYRVVFRLRCSLPSSFWKSLFTVLGGLATVGGLGWVLSRSPAYRIAAVEGGMYRFWVQRTPRRRSYHEDDSDYDTAPEDEEHGDVVHLPLLSLGRGHALIWRDQSVATLKRSLLGTVSVHARPGFVIDGGVRQRVLHASSAGDLFSVTQREESRFDGRDDRKEGSRSERDTSDDWYDF